MSRKKAPFHSYEGRKSKDKHIRLTEDMMLNPNYLKLSSSAKEVYSYMKLWACGEIEFNYAISLALKYTSRNTFIKAKNELLEKGFIELVSGNKFAHIPNRYKFSTNWQIKKD